MLARDGQRRPVSKFLPTNCGLAEINIAFDYAQCRDHSLGVCTFDGPAVRRRHRTHPHNADVRSDRASCGNRGTASGHLPSMKVQRVAGACVAALLALVGCTGRTHDMAEAPSSSASSAPATIEHPGGCYLWPESPTFPVHPDGGARPPTFTANLREQFQTAEPTRLTPDPVVVDDPSVVQVILVRHEMDGMTYTELQAVGVGKTVVHVPLGPAAGVQTTTLRLVVNVQCPA